MENKRWFIADKNNVRWVKCFITENLEWDNCFTHLVVSMNNNFNQATGVKDVMVESIDIKNFFATMKEAQMEIIRRERFNT